MNAHFIPGLRRDDWPLPDPEGKTIEEVRQIRDEIETAFVNLIRECRRCLLLIEASNFGLMPNRGCISSVFGPPRY